ncbi:PX domain-containing protein kinase-like protein [Ischnura elegans]|uniref:PX domain-containing protein kinase-like protein n=1 Tax=Ischnura elegans TaxID=197161 RepID=UPI001ED87CE5|nr:PX domain-containing protein kinase-like protein [Ischnura elegans]
MAVFEKNVPRKITLDDTEVLTCSIENTQNIHGHTEYVIRVQRGPSPDKSWQVFKRYKDFVTLHQILSVSGLSLPMPPKKIIGNMNREFVAERKAALQKYLDVVLHNRYLSMSLAVKKFLDPEPYSLPFEETALQHVSMVLRGELNCQVVKPLPEIGTRLRKHYFLVSNGSESSSPMILSWCEHGPDKFLEDKNLRALFKALPSLQHPFIQPIELAGVNDTGGFVVRRASGYGSLRDMIMGVCNTPPSSNSQPKWQQPFLSKYCCRSGSKNISEHEYERIGIADEEIAVFGAQILDALIFLQEKGLPSCGHLHSGNVIISGGVAKVLEVENAVLGLPQWSRHFILRLPKPRQSSPTSRDGAEVVSPARRSVMSAMDSYCFGRLVYEMATGRELAEATLEAPPPLSPSLRSLLELTLSAESCRNGLPTLKELRALPFFSRVKREMQGHLKMSSALREALRVARMKAEDRMREDQRLLRHQKRLAKVREILNSSDETKLRRVKQPFQAKAPPSVTVDDHAITVDNSVEGKSHESAMLNGRSPEDLRSDSPNSISTVTSASTVTPSPPPSIPGTSTNPCRGALLGSICNFDRNALRHVSANSLNGGSQ